MTKLESSGIDFPANSGRTNGYNDLDKQTLMIVDDYQSNLDAMQSLFGFMYKVVLFDNAKDAINYAMNEEIDLILLDVDMPNMNGYQACEILKSNELTAHIPVIFVTAADSPDEEEKGLLLRAVDYIVKPINLPILHVRVRNQMELVRSRKKLEELSCVDGLTGASNRRQLDTMLLQYYASTIRHGHCLALLMIDIDNFKLYNDNNGHVQGDDCLQQVAQAVMSVRRRETDVVGRYGGEEFAVVLPETDIAGALLVANKVLNKVRDLKIKHSTNKPYEIVTVSIGLAIFEAKGCHEQEVSLEAFVNQADVQLYAAKHNGKNRVEHTLEESAFNSLTKED
jgi:diguanylate cyclase (GGDEF)-like protein